MKEITSGIDRKIRVMQIIEEGRGGGALYRIRALNKYLSESCDVYVVCPKETSAFISQNNTVTDSVIGMRLHSLSKYPPRLFLYLLTFLPEVVALVRLMHRIEPDVVHCNGSWQVKGVLAAALSGRKSVWHMNDSHQPPPVRLMFKWVSSFADSFIFASHRTASYYLNLNAALKSKFHKVISAPIRDKMSLVSKSVRERKPGIDIVTVGYINPNKGLEYLIHGFADFSKIVDTECRLQIIGPVLQSQKKYHDKLCRLIKEHDIKNVDFLGYREDIYGILDNADIYVCASLFESSPISVWEALSRGMVVVSTDVGDVRSLFEEYRCGLVVPTGQSKAICEALLELYENKHDVKSLGQNAMTMARKLFDPEIISSQHANFYAELLNNELSQSL